MAFTFLNRVKSSPHYPLFQRILRAFQFLSALIGLITFSIRMSRTATHNAAQGAAIGIVVTAVVFTISSLLLTLFVNNGAKAARVMYWVVVALDVRFVGAFIAVAVLTRPSGGAAGRGTCGARALEEEDGADGDDAEGGERRGACGAVVGTFATAVSSTILHSVSSVLDARPTKVHQLSRKQEQDGRV